MPYQEPLKRAARNPVLSPEEVAALFQGLREGEADPAPSGQVAETAAASLKSAWSPCWQVLKIRHLRRWLAGLTEFYWPQL